MKPPIFQMYDADLPWEEHGVHRIEKTTPWHTKTKERACKAAQDAGDDILMLNFEGRKLDSRYHNESMVLSEIAHVVGILDAVRQTTPGLRLCMYEAPVRDYHSPTGLWQARTSSKAWWRSRLYQYERRCDEWRVACAKLSPIFQRVDVILSTLYTPYPDRTVQEWDVYASAAIEVSRMFNRPVYGLLWPRFTQAKTRQIKGEHWKRQLSLCSELCDGIVIYLETGHGTTDDEWWKATVEHLT